MINKESLNGFQTLREISINDRFINFYLCVHMCLCECMPHVGRCSWRSQKGTGSSGTGVTFVCESLDVGAGDPRVLWKSRKPS